MNRTRAALIHLWPSLAALAAIAALIVFAWYPYPFLQFPENQVFALLLISIACVIGPVLTWIVYKEHKLKFRFNVVVIVLIQFAATASGLSALYQQRPYFMVFAMDRFDVLSHSDVDTEQITNARFLNKPVSGVIVLYATPPAGKKAYSAFVREVVIEGKPDLQFRPEFWSLYEEKQHLVLPIAKPLSALRSARPESVEAIDKRVSTNGGDINRLVFVPAWGRFGEFAAILDADSGELIDSLVIDPWVNQE